MSAGVAAFDRQRAAEVRTLHSAGWPTLFGVLATQFLVTILLRGIGTDLAPLPSFALVTLACLVALSVCHVLFFRRDVPDRVYAIIAAAFLVRVLVGAVHFLTYINPEYPHRPFETNYEWDYEWLNQEMQRVADNWTANGLLAPMDPSFYVANKNAFITLYNGVLYWATGANVLNYAPWNALHSAYVSYIVVMLAVKLRAKTAALTWIAVLIAFQPFGFISSIFWRDTVGQAWLAMGLGIMLGARTRLWMLAFATPVAAFLSFSVRDPYLLIPLLLLVLLVAKGRLSWQLMMASLAALAVATFAGDLILAIALRRADVAFGGMDLLSLPGRVVRGVIGPFPWYQVTYGRALVPGAPYMIPDFLQHVVSVAVYLLVVPVVVRQWQETQTIDPAFLFGILLFATGLFGLAVHSSYVTVGTAFMLPMLARVDQTRIARMLGRVLLMFVLLNVLWWASGLGAGPPPTY